MTQIITLGETLFDVIFKNGAPVAGKAGGSVLNASISLGKLKCNTSFISEVGKDDLGKSILDFLESNGVDSKYVSLSKENTALAIAMLNNKDDAKYTFYKKSGAIHLNEKHCLGNNKLFFVRLFFSH
jgi:fructokinase